MHTRLDSPLRARGWGFAAALAACIGLLALTPPTYGRVVLHRSIHGIFLGLSQERARTRLGPPDARRSLRPHAFSYETQRWTYRRERLVLELGEVYWAMRIVAVETTSGREQTRDGVGVGSSETRLRQAIHDLLCYGPSAHRFCVAFRPRSPDTRTLFTLVGGRVVRVRIDVRPAPL